MTAAGSWVYSDTRTPDTFNLCAPRVRSRREWMSNIRRSRLWRNNSRDSLSTFIDEVQSRVKWKPSCVGAHQLIIDSRRLISARPSSSQTYSDVFIWCPLPSPIILLYEFHSQGSHSSSSSPLWTLKINSIYARLIREAHLRLIFLFPTFTNRKLLIPSQPRLHCPSIDYILIIAEHRRLQSISLRQKPVERLPRQTFTFGITGAFEGLPPSPDTSQSLNQIHESLLSTSSSLRFHPPYPCFLEDHYRVCIDSNKTSDLPSLSDEASLENVPPLPTSTTPFIAPPFKSTLPYQFPHISNTVQPCQDSWTSSSECIYCSDSLVTPASLEWDAMHPPDHSPINSYSSRLPAAPPPHHSPETRTRWCRTYSISDGFLSSIS
ncbi:hypothetical protein JAAARDRAFT_204183 [Jaapia argillacea MUCL 33604]|uniref:Uncharacterized protein n=1 Tax=Jaapia argillacea MUCL 33604 TaxID=933084 RepID=A0A067Q422_9AGAM|nr:hypothetical protein JAAARDRAFT_204183 [Jaapia argillacea MUCL 33604]